MNARMEIAAVDINQRLDALSAAAAGERSRAETEARQVYFLMLRRLAEGGEFSAAEAVEFADACRTSGKGATEQQADARVIANGLVARKFLADHADLDADIAEAKKEVANFELELARYAEKLRLRAKPSFARLGELEKLENRRLSARREVENLDKLLHPPTAAPPKPPTLPELQIRNCERVMRDLASGFLAPRFDGAPVDQIDLRRLSNDPQLADTRSAVAYLFLQHDDGVHTNDSIKPWPPGVEGVAKSHAKALLKAVLKIFADRKERGVAGTPSRTYSENYATVKLTYRDWYILRESQDRGWIKLPSEIARLRHAFDATTGTTTVLSLSAGVGDAV